MSASLKVCFAASEVAPFAKTGGLADVAAALPAELGRQGHDVRVFLPFYGSIHAERHGLERVGFIQDVPVRLGEREHRFHLWTAPLPGADVRAYFVECRELYHRERFYTQDEDEPVRFALFCRAVLESCQRMGWGPDVVHANDWHAALLPLLLRTVYEWDALFRDTRSLVTIHNIGYQGTFPAAWIQALGLGDFAHLFDQDDLRAGRVNFLRTGLLYAHVVSTVSPTYAREIRTPELGMGLDGLLRAREETLVGILNGVDYGIWSPERDELIPHRYSRKRPEGKRKNKVRLLEEAGLAPGEEAPLFGIVSRLAHQKGFDLCEDVLPGFLAAEDARLVVLGTGEARYETFFRRLAERFRGRVAYLAAYSEEVSHRIEAGADLFLMPSRYEPCGLNQMFSLRYGTIPVVHRTGGLADTVTTFDPETGEGNGVAFEHFTPAGLSWALRYAVELYRDPAARKRVIANAMACNWSWETQAAEYVALYRRMTGRSG